MRLDEFGRCHSDHRDGGEVHPTHRQGPAGALVGLPGVGGISLIERCAVAGENVLRAPRLFGRPGADVTGVDDRRIRGGLGGAVLAIPLGGYPRGIHPTQIGVLRGVVDRRHDLGQDRGPVQLVVAAGDRGILTRAADARFEIGPQDLEFDVQRRVQQIHPITVLGHAGRQRHDPLALRGKAFGALQGVEEPVPVHGGRIDELRGGPLHRVIGLQQHPPGIGTAELRINDAVGLVGIEIDRERRGRQRQPHEERIRGHRRVGVAPERRRLPGLCIGGKRIPHPAAAVIRVSDVAQLQRGKVHPTHHTGHGAAQPAGDCVGQAGSDPADAVDDAAGDIGHQTGHPTSGRGQRRSDRAGPRVGQVHRGDRPRRHTPNIGHTGPRRRGCRRLRGRDLLGGRDLLRGRRRRGYRRGGRRLRLDVGLALQELRDPLLLDDVFGRVRRLVNGLASTTVDRVLRAGGQHSGARRCGLWRDIEKSRGDRRRARQSKLFGDLGGGVIHGAQRFRQRSAVEHNARVEVVFFAVPKKVFELVFADGPGFEIPQPVFALRPQLGLVQRIRAPIHLAVGQPLIEPPLTITEIRQAPDDFFEPRANMVAVVNADVLLAVFRPGQRLRHVRCPLALVQLPILQKILFGTPRR
ncbi:hypothetical protein LAUMK13_03833 [Mycobacterium innocens]|uniref:Uncharacterized protein n=1 Tax=Mycobacterium innocens TaxID=2341083 RepID=A0A498QC70_9MYCO|nr:hypothetical protein LAUMK13_03833 [Mycobacterium innocens]